MHGGDETSELTAVTGWVGSAKKQLCVPEALLESCRPHRLNARLGNDEVMYRATLAEPTNTNERGLKW